MAITEELCPSLLSKAREISVKFEQAFKLFAACLFVYDSAEYLDEEKVDQLGRWNNKLSFFVTQTIKMFCIWSVS